MNRLTGDPEEGSFVTRKKKGRSVRGMMVKKIGYKEKEKILNM
jgi:hypothetical protein